MIELKDYSFSYTTEKEDLKKINLSIKSGEFIVITGNSGSGKTTLGRSINGLVPHFFNGKVTGELKLGEKEIRNCEIWEISKVVASVFQDPNAQFFAHCVKDEIAFGAENYGVDPEIINSRIKSVSNEINIESLLTETMFELVREYFVEQLKEVTENKDMYDQWERNKK